MHTFKTLATLLATLLLCCQSVSGQKISGTVYDENGKAVTYATIYVPAARVGVLTDEGGGFAFDLKEVPDSSRVEFSCIGYESKTYTAGQLRSQTGRVKITLPTLEYLLQTAEVTADRIKFKRKKLGMGGVMNGTYGFVTTDRRDIMEVGTILSPDGPARLDEVLIKVRSMEADSVLMDVNIYDVQFGLVGNPILKKRVFLNLAREDVSRDISVDLSGQRLTVDGSFLVTFRILDVRGTLGEIKLAAKSGPNRGFTRKPDGRWEDNWVTPNIRAVVSYER